MFSDLSKKIDLEIVFLIHRTAFHRKNCVSFKKMSWYQSIHRLRRTKRKFVYDAYVDTSIVVHYSVVVISYPFFHSASESSYSRFAQFFVCFCVRVSPLSFDWRHISAQYPYSDGCDKTAYHSSLAHPIRSHSKELESK